MTPSEQELQQGFQLGDRRVEPNLNRVAGPEGEAHLEPKVMEVLLCLAGNAGDVVSRRALESAVWGQAIVSDQTLTNCISELRRVLGDDRAERRFIETVPKRGYRLVSPVRPLTTAADTAPATERPEGYAPRRRISLVSGIVVLGATLAGGAWWQMRTAEPNQPATVAVSAFENASASDSLDYMRLALPDEVTTVLTQSDDLAVRPFGPPSTGDGGAESSPGQARHMVTGHYYREHGARLTVAIEVRDVEQERLLWRARITAPGGDILELRKRLAARVRDGMMPALGAAPAAAVPTPSNADAYRLYLQSLAVPRDPAPNLRGIELLRETVSRDPDFASGWAELATRYHYDALYGDGGEPAWQRSKDAAQRALDLAPGLVRPAMHLVLLETETGELAAAFEQAANLLRRRDRNPYAHFALSYVLRYGGVLEEALRHCEIALALDPHNLRWRSCGLAYLLHGNPERAQEFIDLAAGSDWAALLNVHLRVRQGDRAGALEHVRSLPADGADRRFFEACLHGGRTSSPDGHAQAYVERWRQRDPEPAYFVASMLAYCGFQSEALTMLQHNLQGGYCPYPALARDPLWEPVREDAGFLRLEERARACHERFRETVDDARR